MDGSGAGEVTSSIFLVAWRRAVTLRFEGYRSIVMLARRLCRLLVEEVSVEPRLVVSLTVAPCHLTYLLLGWTVRR